MDYRKPYHSEDRPLIFDKDIDVCEVEQSGYIDLCKALANNSIPSDVEVGEDSYNNISDPSSILGSPRDVFEAAQMRQSIADYVPPSNNPDGV